MRYEDPAFPSGWQAEVEGGPIMSEFDRFAANYKEVLDQSLAITGDTGEYFADYKARYVARVVSKGFSGKILDFGCGVGLLSAFLKKYLPASTLHGYDTSPASIEKAGTVLGTQGMFTSELQQLDRNYDLIVIGNVLHHVPTSRRPAAILELSERLSPRGRLVVFEHNPANPFTRWIVRHSPLDEDAVLLKPSETRGYLHAVRLRIVQWSYTLFFPRPLAWFRSLERLLAWCPLGAQYAVVAEKLAENMVPSPAPSRGRP